MSVVHRMTVYIAALLATLPLCSGPGFAADAGAADDCQWRKVGAADMDGDGRAEEVALRVCGGQGSVRVNIHGLLRSLEFPLGSQNQFGVCGTVITASITTRSSAPFEALGSYPSGYEECLHCAEISVSDDACDPLNIYWRADNQSLDWWRA